ncbi:hypothetical protein VTN31DRAFT_4736 [Thermomyces dupontii]|uniref:uncharacterized protein n=1 Tax=Talaromyces thermophilus TaxID=28565 RepID=UPI003743B136
MAWRAPGNGPAAATSPSRQPGSSQQSSSLPSTPYQQPRGLPFQSRSPSPRRRSTSPHSTQSETNPLPSFRKPLGGCKYETGMAFFRRRMPYSLGGDMLPEEKVGLKERLNPEEEEALSADMRELYDRLLPSAESDDRRRQLVQKLDKLLNEQFPGSDIKVHVFGSSGNKLCSSDSDVDICITTPRKELENVCLLAEVLANHGMERVVCVSHAKVPIVKIWDPQLKLACDMNVNNTLALENTRMVRTYVEIDERVRPLAMIVKYWTKRRVLNDAALGGTLSSYTWICLIINFLQTRDPPILPSLQRRSTKKNTTIDGVQVSFDDNISALAGFGKANKQSLGDLLFQFFRYYGHEVDYEKYVISVREGKLISKEGKGWHLLQNNRLCVEEPFNTTRNLGNTADDTSFKGLHMELRRAFKAISEANLEKCCEQYVFPPEEERVWERPPPQPRPVLTPNPGPTATRGGRGGGRGGRHPNQFGRGGSNNAGRRSSTAANRANHTNGFRPGYLGLTPEMTLQAQQAQYLLHDQLYQQIQLLQAQEQELRMQLHNQSLLTGRVPPVLIRQPLIPFPFPQQQQQQQQEQPSGDEGSRVRAGTVNHPPLTAPLRPGMFYAPAYIPVTTQSVQGTSTNPPSPSAQAAAPELRRSPRRSSLTDGSPGGSMRSHSQPARPVSQHQTESSSPTSTDQARQPTTSGSPPSNTTENESSVPPGSVPSYMPRPGGEDLRATEYAGYFMTPQQVYHHNLMAMYATPMLTPYIPPMPDFRPGGYPFPETMGTMSEISSSAPNGPLESPPATSAPSRAAPSRDGGPLIVDGSVPPSDHRSASHSSERTERFPSLPLSSPSEMEAAWGSPPKVSSDGFPSDASPEPMTFEMDPFHMSYRDPEGHNRLREYEAGLNGHGGRLGGLSHQFQNLHVSRPDDKPHQPSTPEKTGDSKPSVNGERLNDSRSGPLSQSEDRVAPNWPTGGSKAGGSPTPTSGTRRRMNGHESSNNEKPNGVSQRTKATTSSSTRKDGQNASVPRRGDDGAPRERGPTHNNGGWQTTTKKKHKRSARSVAENQPYHMAEPLPADESMRKGG